MPKSEARKDPGGDEKGVTALSLSLVASGKVAEPLSWQPRRRFNRPLQAVGMERIDPFLFLFFGGRSSDRQEGGTRVRGREQA